VPAYNKVDGYQPYLYYADTNLLTSGATFNVLNTWTSANSSAYPPPQQSEWERAMAKAAVKAEPDDEFTWLRRRVREVEDRAFA
jgi:hypothetical protein